MPELLTKYPDVTMKVLESEGARCGPGHEQKILETCPPEQFCTLAGGELCVYGLDQADRMTQISPRELRDAAGDTTQVATAAPTKSGCTITDVSPSATPSPLLFVIALVLLRRRPCGVWAHAWSASSWSSNG